MKIKNEIRKKKKSRPPDWPFFSPTQHTGNDFLLKGGLIAELIQEFHINSVSPFKGGGETQSLTLSPGEGAEKLRTPYFPYVNSVQNPYIKVL